jgi:hypothetical protein
VLARFCTAILVALVTSGCASAVRGTPVEATFQGSDRDLIDDYFEALNESASRGAPAQRDFLTRTQHPDFTDRLCDLGELTVWADPAMSTLRPDPRWSPEGAQQLPRGTVYVVAVALSLRRETARVAEQIASQRIVVLDGSAYSFSPCPA